MITRLAVVLTCEGSADGGPVAIVTVGGGVGTGEGSCYYYYLM